MFAIDRKFKKPTRWNMLSSKKREMKSFIYFACDFNVTPYLTSLSHAALYPVCMIADYADSSLWQRHVTSLRQAGRGRRG